MSHMYTCHGTHMHTCKAYVCVTHTSRMYTCASWLIDMSHVNESCLMSMSHEAHVYICLTSMSHVSCQWVMSHVNESCLTSMSHVSRQWVMRHMYTPKAYVWMGHDSLTWDMTHWHVIHVRHCVWVICPWLHRCVWVICATHDSLTCDWHETWVIDMWFMPRRDLCDMPVWHASFICVTCLCDMPHSYVWHDWFMSGVTCVTCIDASICVYESYVHDFIDAYVCMSHMSMTWSMHDMWFICPWLDDAWHVIHMSMTWSMHWCFPRMDAPMHDWSRPNKAQTKRKQSANKAQTKRKQSANKAQTKR